MTHTKRLGIPKTWPMSRKGLKFAVTPDPGPHAKEECMPLRVILRNLLRYAENAKETRNIIVGGKILVDKKPRKNDKFPVGLMDVIEIPETKQHFRMITKKTGLGLEELDESDASSKTCKITGKTTLKKGMMQLNLHDGRNILVTKRDTYKPGDSVVISLPGQKIIKHLKLEKGSHGFITAGRNIGIWGKIKDIESKEHMLEKPTVTIDSGHSEIKTLKDYIFVAEPAKGRTPTGTGRHPEGHKHPHGHKHPEGHKEGK
jgi:small subunit ribosomal protein S4e